MKRLAAISLLLVFFATELFAQERKVLTILGDSIASGYGVEPDESFPALLQKRIDAAALPFAVQNAGVSGDTTAGGLRRADWVLKKPVDVLIVELGGNDGLRGLPLSQTRTNLQGIIAKARQKYPEIKIVLAGMQMPPNMGPDYTKEFSQMYPELAQSNKVALIPFLLEGVGGKDEMNQPDRIHPNPEGHAKVSENVWTVIKPILESFPSK